MTALTEMTLAQLTEVYNGLAAKPIKKFTCSREQAIAKIEALQPKSVAPTKSASKKLGIGAKTVELLKFGMKPAAVLATLRAEFGEQASSMACVYWYSSKIRCGLY